jgi:SAM-dependent methyltransferase
VYSHQYNPSGKSNGENYRFPVEAGSFDAIFAASLFTHLLPAETLNYFRQCRLALKPGGKCLFSFFLLNRYGGRDKVISPSYEFEYPLEGHPGVASRNPIHPSETIAYNSATVKAIAADAGLAVTNEVPGYWSTTSDFAVNEQDLIVLAAV